MSADLLRLLAQAHPDRAQADLLAMLGDIPNKKPATLPVRSRSGSRPRTGASVERRRSWAAAGRLPPALAAKFTTGEVAVLAVVTAEVARYGRCTLYVEKIAALAGVTRSTVKRALRAAEALGAIRVQEQRLTAWRNAANIVMILDPAWCAWMRLRRRGEGSNLEPARNTRLEKAEKKGFRGVESPGTAARGDILRACADWERPRTGYALRS